MRKHSFIIFFIMLHLLFIGLQIHKQSIFVKYFYEKQRFEQEYEYLISRKHKLEEQLAVFYNPHAVKQFASQNLGMKLIKKRQIKKVHV